MSWSEYVCGMVRAMYVSWSGPCMCHDQEHVCVMVRAMYVS